ncbi:MAG: rhomboid family intramembrane serine protease [Bacteroidota bacterium]|nr:rhomboid family intramembrane serine protease [Bacteroidota bacterium]
MNSFLEDLRNNFTKSGSSLNQIIIINLVVFLVLIVMKVILTISGVNEIYHIISNYIFLPAYFMEFAFKPWTIITYFFTHEEFFHILFNMIFLYWFGQLITEFLGNKRLVNLYILGGIAGGILYLVMYNTIPYFSVKAYNTALLGASGAVYAVVLGAATLLPDYTFYLIFIGPVRIKYIAAAYLILSFAQMIGPNAGGNIAHLGGGIMGMLYIWQLRRGNDWGKPIEKMSSFFNDLFKPRPKIEVSYKSTTKKKMVSNDDDISQAELDAILDKISKFGYEKLTKEEKQKLFKASQSTHI